MEPPRENGQGGPSREALVRDLVLMLLYLTSWRERKHDRGIHAWRGMDWGALDALRDRDLLWYRNWNKSVDFSREGVHAARALLGQYGFTRALGEMKDWGLDIEPAAR